MKFKEILQTEFDGESLAAADSVEAIGTAGKRRVRGLTKHDQRTYNETVWSSDEGRQVADKRCFRRGGLSENGLSSTRSLDRRIHSKRPRALFFGFEKRFAIGRWLRWKRSHVAGRTARIGRILRKKRRHVMKVMLAIRRCVCFLQV